MRTRLLVLAAAVAVASATALPGHAVNRKPQITDPANDSLGGQASMEIVSALWTTTGETYREKVRGRWRTTYLPKKLVVTMNLAGAPATSAPFAYETSAQVAGCGDVRFVYSPGTVYSMLVPNGYLWYDCGPGDQFSGPGLTLVPGIPVKLGAKSITWEYSIKAFGKTVKPGAAVGSFRAATDIVDPVFAIYGTNAVQPVDVATGDVVWKLGS